MMTHITYLTLSDPFIGLKLTYLSNRLSTSANMSVCGSVHVTPNDDQIR